MDNNVYNSLKIIWDYMHMNMELSKADCIVGFGNYNVDIPVRVAELYEKGYAKKVLFTGGLGRNTDDLWVQTEAERFAEIAEAHGIPRSAMILENHSTNTGENILFTRKKFASLNMKVTKIIGVHQQFMERRIYAAMKAQWPELEMIVTSPQTTIQEYLDHAQEQGIEEKQAIDVIVGDFQRIDTYARRGYQIPQYIPQEVMEAFHQMVNYGYARQLAMEKALF